MRKSKKMEEAMEEVMEEVKEEVMEEVKEEAMEEVKEEAMEEVKEEVKEEAMEEVKGMSFGDVMAALAALKLSNEEIKALRNFVKGLKLERGEEGGRKEELVELLSSVGRLNIKEISGKMGISAKNVSSLLMYLKKDGVRICTDCEGRKFIEK
jgi:pyridoxal biosynthesis lyase PdxS